MNPIIASAIGLVVSAFTLGTAVGYATFHTDTPDPYSQSSFPCAEDAALVYGPEFGPDKVGCIAIDDLRD